MSDAVANVTARHGDARGAWFHNEETLFALGAIAWLITTFVRWPTALSFGDEIGYLGQAKLFLEGRVRPTLDSPGIWNPTPTGPVAQYPLFASLPIALFFAVSPTLIFLLGTLSALGLAWTASRALKSWGCSPCWGLLILAHPTIIVLARTVMTDLLLTALAVGAWWALRKGRVAPAVALLAATMATRATGVLIAGAIIAGEVVGTMRGAGQGAISARRQFQIGAIGFALGSLIVLAMNALATGTPWFGYFYRPGLPSFRLTYFLTVAPVHARSLLLNPPLLFLGVLPLWQRRLFAPLLVTVGIGMLMAFYFFVDSSPSWAETMVLSPRLILPTMTFLLIGYASILARIVARTRMSKIASALLVIAPAAINYEIGSRHLAWQLSMREARQAAIAMTRRVGTRELGLTYGSSKAGLLFPGKTTWVVGRGSRPPVFLCSTHGNSYRAPQQGNLHEDRCDEAGYHRTQSLDGYVLMLRDDIQMRAHAPP